MILDGSIQGWTAKMGWPGYYTGTDQGQWMVPPEQVLEMCRPFHERQINIHAHCNGDLTIDLWIDTVEQLVRESAWLDHRHTVQHCQLTTAAQYRRMARLGMCANIFANHLWYWGDEHHDLTVGPERARRMEACAAAEREGVSFSLHSDANRVSVPSVPRSGTEHPETSAEVGRVEDLPMSDRDLEAPAASRT